MAAGRVAPAVAGAPHAKFEGLVDRADPQAHFGCQDTAGSLGPGGNKAPDYLPPGKTPPLPYMQLVVPPPPATAPAAPAAG